MRIINAHVHMIEADAMFRDGDTITLPGGVSVLREIKQTLPLLSPDVLLEQMDDADIETAVLYAVDAPIVYASNQYVQELCNKYPERLMGFASVNPLAADAADTLENAVEKMNMRGLKLHPPLQGFAPDDERVFPVYDKAQELGLPVVFHVGSTPFGSMCRLKYADPLKVDDVAVNFPDLPIMLTHLGTLWHNEAFMVVEKNPNVFIDTAGYLNEICKILTPEIISRIGSDKIIFGTDYPMPYGAEKHRMKDFVDCIRKLAVSEQNLQNIFADNFERLLKGRFETTQTLSIDDLSK